MGRQKKLPGTEGPEDQKPIEDIERAAEAYTKAAAASSRQRKKTAESRDALLALLHEHKRTSYKAEDGVTYTIGAGKEKIIVTEAGGEDSDGDEGGEE